MTREIRIVESTTLDGLKEKVELYRLDGWETGSQLDESLLQFGKYSIAVIRKETR